MTHMHIPDGVLPVWLWILGFIIMSCIVGFCVLRLKTMDMRKKIPLLGAVSAAMLVAMTLEIIPLAYHINLSVIAGILLGPSLGFLAAFITNLILALMGHGGVTVMGLNTLLLGSEAVLGHTFFFLLKNRMPVFARAAVSTIATLVITTLALIGIVAVAHIDPDLMLHAEEHAGRHHLELSLSRFAVMALSLGAVGWLIEAFITGVVIRFISQVKPDMLVHVLHENQAVKHQKGA